MKNFNHKLPPDGHKVDYSTMNRDLAIEKYEIDVMRKCNKANIMLKRNKYRNKYEPPVILLVAFIMEK